MTPEIVFSPTDFVATLNQTLEFTYPVVAIEGELADFRVAKNRWVYFNLKDEVSSVPFFGTVYSLPGPLEDGLVVRVIGVPRLHQRFGFTVNFESILPVGQGSLKKAADLLFQKLSKEGLFVPERKRALPQYVQKLGLITAADSAAAADFIKILNERWVGVDVSLADTYVQGEQAPLQLIKAIKYFNELRQIPEVLVITRGGGSAEDLSAFNDERVVRAVATSRIPTLVAIGHEVDISLAELAADQRASTPSNAVQLLTPDKKHLQVSIRSTKASLVQMLSLLARSKMQDLQSLKILLNQRINNFLMRQQSYLTANRRLIRLFDPAVALRRGYAMVSLKGRYVKSVRQIKIADRLSVILADGKIETVVEQLLLND